MFQCTQMECCINDAIFYLQKALEALTEGLKDPEKWKETSEAATRVISKSLPLILALQIVESLEKETQKSLQDTLQ